MTISGVFLPLITPFLKGKIDIKSYASLLEYYIKKGVHGIIPLATTGESPTINEAEYEQIIDRTIEIVNSRVKVFIGLSGNDTNKLIKQLKNLNKYNIDGILSACPYYNLPSQNGIYSHFKKMSESTDLTILLYNIPYRTGRNIENDTIFRLAECKNINGIKDSCGDFKKSMELLLHRPKNFSVLTGEDIFYFNSLALGSDGGILASAHLHTEKFVKIYNLMKDNNFQKALEIWKDLAEIIPNLFIEPNPAPVKYCLMRKGLIKSSETRLPLTGISNILKKKLDILLS
jgi:4-hydroxy-tetrahydrodipicolinate synthase